MKTQMYKAIAAILISMSVVSTAFAAAPSAYAGWSGNQAKIIGNSGRSGVYTCQYTLKVRLSNGNESNYNGSTDVAEGLTNGVFASRSFSSATVVNAELLNWSFNRKR